MRKLHFMQAYPPYNTGEEASFADAQAEQLVRRGVAIFVDPPPPVEVEDPAPPSVATKAPSRPPADKMARPSQTVRKKK